MVPVYFKMFQLIFNEKLSTSEVGSLILKKMQSVATSRQNHVTRSEILPKEIYIKKIWNYIVMCQNEVQNVHFFLHLNEKC